MCLNNRKTLNFLSSCFVILTIFDLSFSQVFYNYNYNPYYRRGRGYSSYNAAANAAAVRLRQLQSQLANTNRLQNGYTNYGNRINGYNANTLGAATLYTNTNFYRRPNNNGYRNSPYVRATTISPYTTATNRQDTSTISQNNRNPVTQADANNSKFSGTNNQEAVDESSKTYLQLNSRQFSPYPNLCQPYGRDPTTTGRSTSADLKGQGRFLGVNVYNVYAGGGSGCRDGYGGVGGIGGIGGLSDPYQNPYPPTPLNAFLSLFTPVATRPQYYRPQGDPATGSGGGGGGGEVDPAVDPNFGPQSPPPVRPPPVNQIYFDTPNAAPITPGQFVGSVATTVNGIIQQLTGNVQPVYAG